jgi:4-amino-4-deoxy-L-arabinose transferase-like glycosyltransferase
MRRYLPLLAVVLLAFAMRANRIREPLIDAYSWREASTAMMAENFYRRSWNIFLPAVNWVGPQPGYQGREFQITTYLAALCYTVLGQHDWIGRGINVLFGTWSVVALYLLTRRVWDEPRAIATALVQAILPGAVFVDRSFLPDPAMLALALTACWMLIVHLQTERRRYLLGACVFGALALLAKLPAIVAIVPVIYLLTRYRRRNALKTTAVVACVFAPVVAYYCWAIYVGRHYPPYHIAGESNWIWSQKFTDILHRAYYLPQTARELALRLWTLPAVVFFLIGLFVRPPRHRWFFHFWLLGCVLLYLAGARELTMNPWNFHIFSVACSGLCGNAIAWIATSLMPSARGRLAPIAVAGFIIFISSMMTLRTLYDRPQGYANYRMGRALHDLSRDGDLVVTLAADIGDPIAIYYSGRRGWIYPPAHRQDIHPQYTMFPDDENVSIALFDDLLNQGAKWIGIVIAPMDDHDPQWNFWQMQPRLVEHLHETCDVVEKKPGYVIYRVKPNPRI